MTFFSKPVNNGIADICNTISLYDDFMINKMDTIQQLLHEFCFEDELPSTTLKNPKKTKSRGEKRKVFYIADDGYKFVLSAKTSPWYKIYIQFPDIECKAFQKLFRNRFRMPYAQFLEILGLCKSSDLFLCWSDEVSLLVLTSLRYIGRLWTFDNLSESTGISREVIHSFFHKFIEFGSTELFE